MTHLSCLIVSMWVVPGTVLVHMNKDPRYRVHSYEQRSHFSDENDDTLPTVNLRSKCRFHELGWRPLGLRNRCLIFSYFLSVIYCHYVEIDPR